MHDVIPNLTAEDRQRSLGWLAVWWIEMFTVIGRGGATGKRIRHAPEYFRFIVDCYALDKTGRRRFGHVFLSRPKGCNKSGIAAELALFEAFGPCRFAGWAKGGETYTFLGCTYTYRKGEPMGRPIQSPLVVCLATEEGQPLALDTPVATTKGWKTVGELQIGDSVFGSDGRPTPIRRMTKVFNDLDCYKVTFSDGETIVASGSHMWTLERRTDHDGHRENVTVTTEQISKDFHSSYRGNRYRMKITPAFEMPDANLPVDPYFLGLWLGDGHYSSATIAYDVQDEEEDKRIIKPLLLEGERMVIYEHVGRCGTFNITRENGRKNLDSMRSRLRKLNVLYNKHIPHDYLWASKNQRLALLQGLMDSDGTIDQMKHRARFVNTNRALIDGIEELLTGLGYKWDETCREETSSWVVNFQPRLDCIPFRLSRKRNRVVEGGTTRAIHRYIVNVERTESVPVRCIGIDNADHLFAAGKHMILTHNTGNVYDSVYYNCTEGALSLLAARGMDAGKTRVLLPQGGMIRYSTAAARSKDGGLETFICFDETHQYNNKRLHDMYDISTQNLTKRGIEADPWYLETTTMYRPGEGSVAEDTYRLARDLETGRLKGFEDLLFDHRYANLSRDDFADDVKLKHAIYEAYGSAMRSPDDHDYVFTPDGRMVPVGEDGRSVEGWSLRDPGVEPGPSVNGWCDIKKTFTKIIDPTYDPDKATRFYLNNLASAADAWLSESMIQSHLAFQDAVAPAIEAHDLGFLNEAWRRVVQPDEEITLGFDGSVSDDSTALVGCRVRDGLLFLVKLEQKPDGPQAASWRVDRDSFDGRVRWMFAHYNVIGMFADTDEWEPYIAQWELDFGSRLRVWPRSNGNHIRFPMNGYKRDVMAELKTLYAAFREPMRMVPRGDLPDGTNVMLFADPRLVDHFRNARRRDRAEGYLVFKETPNSPHKIDAMMAGLLAYRARSKYLGMAEEAEEESVMPIRVS